MNHRIIFVPVLSAACFFVLLGAGSEKPGRVTPAEITPGATSSVLDSRESLEATPTVPTRVADRQTVPRPSAVGALFNGSWLSINGGGMTEVASTSYRMGLSAGQAASGEVTGTDWELGFGYWYGAGVPPVACPVVLTGDVNLAGGVNSTDIIYLVNFVLKAGPAPFPCEASGDANCTGDVNSTDIIVLVNYVLKGGPPPCDVCTLIPGTWGCL